MPKVSVIVPVYKVEPFIERCAESLFQQTLDDIEYIFIDDCSPDRSMTILKSVIERYPGRKEQVKIYSMPEHSGIAIVRQLGIQEACGEFIISCDSDDWTNSDMFLSMYNLAKESDSDIVVCDYYKSNSGVNTLYRGINRDCSTLLSDILTRRAPAAVWNKLVKRSLYVNNEIEYPVGDMGEDCVIMIQLISKANRLSYSANPFYYYNYNPNSITTSGSKEYVINRFNQAVSNALVIERFLSENGYSSQYNGELVFFKHLQRNTLSPFIKDRECFYLWRSVFSGINLRVISLPYLTLKQKIKYFLALTGIRRVL